MRRAGFSLDLTSFTFVSLHAPSRFSQHSEQRVIQLLSPEETRVYPVAVHPDVVFTPSIWRRFSDRLLIENIDKRKPVGRVVTKYEPSSNLLPDAGVCFDIGHARQVDPTMTEATLLLQNFGAHTCRSSRQ
jgi:hypothetical protein